MILNLCDIISETIHKPLFHNFYNIADELKYNQTFTSIDLIEDSQIAIEEFENIDTNGIGGRSTLLIYGILQSLFVQQDGLYHLYKCIVDFKVKQKDFFDLFSFDHEIREVRNDIAGHPTNRKKSEYYFIEKGVMSKYKFTYVGYTPQFRKVNVDLKTFISNQYNFTKRVLLFIQYDIDKKIKMKKEEHKSKKLQEMIFGVDRNRQLIYRGIRDEVRSFQGQLGISEIKKSIEEIKMELNSRYNENLPDGVYESFRLIYYIIQRLDGWQKENELLGNDDAEIFLDSLCKQLGQLGQILKEIDLEFEDS
ncbi:hypothetical protein [Mariniflexile sp. AS56]|uniref:hypothetical protein n=1 Tax=Mariniflexile sp. AS56 TaxID=3063957 RepID=UPI0026F10DC2|nr:hypothetical protein [Mariniflexile sp. AS56]MDO7173600.1 hypothetical protein [Mariniflexile sp. AS56]